VLVAAACGDALGAGYEFGPPLPTSATVEMAGGRQWEPGEWTDDTAMAVAVAEVAAEGIDLRHPPALTRIGIAGRNGRWRPRTSASRPRPY